ncbi:MAG: class I SAM-dependent methyltransferase [Acidiferrobacterales bacterium]|nr:class I SAM-dependent methyltransferase [Acidiferrobacterales bacterium]
MYVGVGHGFDALLALNTGLTEHIIGVDPYIDSDGNDNEDYDHLMNMLDEFNMQDCFSIERMTIQKFLQNNSGRFDLIICNDVLHHIFWTDALLSESELFPEALSLFRMLRKASRPGGNLVVADVERHGLRQILSALGVLKTSVNYGTKQPRREWCRAAANAGWMLANQANYVPWRLRGQMKIWSGLMGRFTVCDKYLLHFNAPDH